MLTLLLSIISIEKSFLKLKLIKLKFNYFIN